MDFLLWNLRLCFFVLVHSVLVSSLGNETDRRALLAFKQVITQDPYHVMSSWNGSTHFCKWIGVTCSLRHHQRVVSLNLGNNGLVGTISPSVGNLSLLKSINLSRNHFNSKIPEEFGRLSSLQYLDLSYNSLEGEIPVNLSNCRNLTYLRLLYNSLTGNIPFQLSSLKNLISFRLSANNLTGPIPSWIGNCSSLMALSLAQNSLHGIIPDELGQLSKLIFFQVAENNLSGVIPPSLYNITSIYMFSVAVNQLHGSIPVNLGQTLPYLEQFFVDLNYFSGPIPNSLSNASNLQVLEFGYNAFTGSIPNNLGSLKSLNWLALHHNKLGYGRPTDLDFLTSLSNCTLLDRMTLADNRLGGVVPESIGNLSSHFQRLTFGGNLIHGPLPTSIDNLASLILLDFENNLLSGSIPFGIGKLQKLNLLHLQVNKLSGQIPSSLGNMTQLIFLYMYQNNLEGIIPPTLGNCKKLNELRISNNKASGVIPKEVLTLSSLIYFSVANNSLSGSLPLEVGNLINLQVLEVSGNKLSGELPTTLGKCIKLEELLLGHNLFHGHIPMSFKILRLIQIIDFSHNNLTGMIPEFLKSVSFLESLDLSYNDFDGEVPKEGIFMNATAISVRGNRKLCGGIKELHLSVCSEKEGERSRKLLPRRKLIIISFGGVSFILVVVCCFSYCLWTSKKQNTAGASTSEKWKHGVSYSEIFYSTDGFSRECLIGEGSFGSVYKGVSGGQEHFVAIKVLNLHQKGASKSFVAECEVLKNIRHRNILKIETVCSSIDFYGKEFKALIFEFMPNGSLERWLHPNVGDQESSNLNFIQRLNIIIDVAYGLEYLHHSYEETIVHLDIKPSNILLDRDMTAHLGDFGLARFLLNTSDDQAEAQVLSSSLKGSIGYIPPEYGIGGKVSTLGDIYSYGILLLEMFTGKRPTDEMFKDGLTLHEFVAVSFPDRVLDIIDASMLSETLEEEDKNRQLGNVNESEEAPALSKTMEWKMGECLVSVLATALSSCAPLPKDRPVVSTVVNKLISIRELFICASQSQIKGCL